MPNHSLYDLDFPVSHHPDIDVPSWIESDITFADVAAICEGGCASGSYMPAVTYHEASATMADHGDDVLEYLDGEGVQVSTTGESWSGIAVAFLSAAVESWAMTVQDQVEDDLRSVEHVEPGCLFDGVRGDAALLEFLGLDDDADAEEVTEAIEALQDDAAPWIDIRLEEGSIVAFLRGAE